MKQLAIVLFALGLCLLGWRVIESISSDALGLAIGVVFGVLAGLPTALLVLKSRYLEQESEVERYRRWERQRQEMLLVAEIHNEQQRNKYDMVSIARESNLRIDAMKLFEDMAGHKYVSLEEAAKIDAIEVQR